MAYPDRSDILSRVRDLLDESSAGFFTDAQIVRWINDGERDVAIKGLCIESIKSVATVANTRTVAAPYNKVMAVECVPSSGDPRFLAKVTPRHFGHGFDSGTEPQAWSQWGNEICIEPIPTAAYNLNIYASILPTCEMSESTDEPQVPAAFVPLIAQYAFIRGLYKDRLYGVASGEYKSYITSLQVVRDIIIEKYAEMLDSERFPDSVVAK